MPVECRGSPCRPPFDAAGFAPVSRQSKVQPPKMSSFVQNVWISRESSIKRFTLYGSPHSLPTYKVALMLHLSGEPFSFRYVSFQKNMHKTSEFRALSRWGQVPVLLDRERVYLQSAAIVEHLAETLRRFEAPEPVTRQAVREWLYWDVDALFPPIFNCYSVELG